MAKVRLPQPKAHPGYDYSQSVEWNLMKGRRAGYAWLTIGKQNEAESIRLRNSSPAKSRRANEVAHKAYELHDKYGN